MTESDLRHFRIMKNRRLSIFVDESGKFQVPDALSPFYIVGLVFHDQDESIDELVCKLDADWDRMGYEKFCFHAGPLSAERDVAFGGAC